MKEITLQVTGMSCGHCVKAVTEALYTLEGVDLVEIELDKAIVKVHFNEEMVSIDQLKDKIEDQGYDIAS